MSNNSLDDDRKVALVAVEVDSVDLMVNLGKSTL